MCVRRGDDWLEPVGDRGERSCGSENDGHDESVQRDGFSEDHQEDDTDEDIIVLHALHADFTAETDGETRCEGGETDAEAGAQVLVSVEPSVVPLRWVAELL